MWDRMPYLCADEYSRLLRFGLESPGRVYGAIHKGVEIQTSKKPGRFDAK